MATLRDVAGLAGVSTMTVSRVVNNPRDVKSEARARVESAIAQLGFVPSAVGRLLAQKRRRTSLSISGSVPDGNYLSEKESVNTDEQLVFQDSNRRPGPAPQRASIPPGDTARAMLRIVRAAQPISRVDLARRLE